MALARRQTWITVRIDDEWFFHYRAAAACRLAGPDIRTPLLGDWIRLLTETKAQSPEHEDACFCFTMAAIGNLSPSACEPLIEALTNANPQLRIYSATALGQFHSSHTEQVLSALLDRLRNDTNSGVQSIAVSALGWMPPTVVPVLLRELKGHCASARRGSLVALGSFTNEALIIVPAVLTELADPEVEVRRAATNALKALSPQTAAEAGVE
jgi:HEAT repeat protein